MSKQITDLKKEVNKREQQKKEMADVIEQDILVEIKGRRPIKLPEVFIRPALDGKRLPGEVEIHQNGLRYQSPMGSQKIGTTLAPSHHTNLTCMACRHIVQQRTASLLPAMRPRASGDYPHPLESSYHDWEEESTCTFSYPQLICDVLTPL